MKICKSLCVSILLLLFLFTLSIPQEFSIPFKAIGRIFLIPTDTVSIGTAFVAGKSKSIYTCSHVVKADTMWFFGYNSDYRYRIRLKYNLPNYDVAFLERTAGEQQEFLEFGEFNRIQPGDTIYYIGWNMIINAYKINKAIVLAKGSSFMESDVKVDFLEFEGEAIPGYSGGPVLDCGGKVIAMIREAWSKKGIKGGKVIKINRAFSIELLKVLDSEIMTGSIIKENKIDMSLIELFAK